MARTVVIDEFHLEVRVSADLPAARARAACRTLADRRWVRRLRRAVQASLRADPALAHCRLTIGR